MSYQSCQMNIVDSLYNTAGSVSVFDDKTKRINISLLIETLLVLVSAVLAIRFLAVSNIFRATWFLSPGILVLAAFVPTAIRKADFPKIGIEIKQVGPTILIVFKTCIVIFSVLLVSLWLLKSFGLALPLEPNLPDGQSWVSWLFYQFMYIAVAEEVFFRGYVQHNILKLTGPGKVGKCCMRNWFCIVLSAVFFAAAHVVVQGRIVLALTFLPGLVLGWLFVRTRSLLAPILFHGLANTSYCLMATVFTS